jgi:hypothetical protein
VTYDKNFPAAGILLSTRNTDRMLLNSPGSGISLIPEDSELTRLNYFDGQFLRASHLNLEQRYLRRLVEFSNQAGGGGITHGFSLSLGSGDTLNVSDGLAIDPQGRVLLLAEKRSVSIAELIARSAGSLRTTASSRRGSAEMKDCVQEAAATASGVLDSTTLYLVTLNFAEALCGPEDVYGQLCDNACHNETQRAYWLEGVVLRVRPLSLRLPLATSSAATLTRQHLRSLVASAYFEQERREIASLISKSGLASEIWCAGAEADGGADVPVGVLMRAGTSTILDSWTVRRERIETPPHRYWQWRMAMRPKDVFLAQVLQFQCQLRDLTRDTTVPQDDPCSKTKRVLSEAEEAYFHLSTFYSQVAERLVSAPGIPETDSMKYLRQKGSAPLRVMSDQLRRVKEQAAVTLSERALIDGGIVELPSAGYLPVVPGDAMTVNEQVRRWMGEGVDLRFCAVRPDFVPHAWEEAQHMERISLLEGLDDAKRKPRVDILVPEGEITRTTPQATGTAFQARLLKVREGEGFALNGAARFESTVNGPLKFYAAVAGTVSGNYRTVGKSVADYADIARDAKKYMARQRSSRALDEAVEPAYQTQSVAAWGSLEFDRDPFSMRVNDQTAVRSRMVLHSNEGTLESHDIQVFATLRVLETKTGNTSDAVQVRGILIGAIQHRVRSAIGNTPGAVPPVPLTVVMVRTATRIKVQIVSDVKGFEYSLDVVRGGDPLLARGTLRFQTPDFDSEPAPAELEQDPAVLTSGNANNTLARAALDVIEAALGENGFSASSAKLLFATPEATGGELVVKATRDWVLFHRRREKDCGQDAPKPQAPPRRQYQIYQLELTADSLDLAKRIRSLLQTAAPELAKVGFESAGQIIFEGGSAQLASDDDAVRASWALVKPGKQILYSAIGSRGAAEDEGPALGNARLAATVAALAPLSVPIANAISEDLPGAPLAVTGTDGSIFILTVTPVAKTFDRERIYSFTNKDLFDGVRDLVAAGQWTAIEEKFQGVLLADLRFESGTAIPEANEFKALADKWLALGVGKPRLASVVYRDTPATIPALAVDRFRATMPAFGSNQTNPIISTGLRALEADIQSVVLVLIQTVEPARTPTAPEQPVPANPGNTTLPGIPGDRVPPVRPDVVPAQPPSAPATPSTTPVRPPAPPATPTTTPATPVAPVTPAPAGPATPVVPVTPPVIPSTTPAPVRPVGRAARLMFVKADTASFAASGRLADLFPTRTFLVKFTADSTLDGPLPDLPPELRARVRRVAIGTPGAAVEAGAERRAKALVGGLVQLGLIVRDATGAPQFDLDSAALPVSLRNQLTDGASELILAEVLG